MSTAANIESTGGTMKNVTSTNTKANGQNYQDQGSKDPKDNTHSSQKGSTGYVEGAADSNASGGKDHLATK